MMPVRHARRAQQTQPRLSILSRDPSHSDVEVGIERARLLPAQHVERFNELADPVNLCAEQAKLGNARIPLRFVWRKRKSECAKDPTPRTPLASGGEVGGVLCIDGSWLILSL